jgi:hypothetical protein
MIPLKDDSPSASQPVVTISLIVSCACVFLWQRSLDTALPFAHTSADS